MKRTRLFLLSLLPLALTLGLAACAGSTAAPPAGISATSVPSPQPVASPTLGAPPSDCPLKPPPQTRDFVHFGQGSDTHFIGGSPVWLAAPLLPSILHLGPLTGWKIVIDVGPDYAAPISLSIRDYHTRALLPWMSGKPAKAVTQTLILDPNQQDYSPSNPAAPHGSPQFGWNEWGVYPTFPRAGCYTLEVSWPTGSWQSTFAVGH